MSWTCTRGNREVVGRKAHRCDVCFKTIPKGERHVQRSGVESGEGFYTMHLHLACEVASKDWDAGDWECR